MDTEQSIAFVSAALRILHDEPLERDVDTVQSGMFAMLNTGAGNATIAKVELMALGQTAVDHTDTPE